MKKKKKKKKIYDKRFQRKKTLTKIINKYILKKKSKKKNSPMYLIFGNAKYIHFDILCQKITLRIIPIEKKTLLIICYRNSE